nr:DNA mismatch repair endonuclease MutL [Clostridia bacterium]
MAKINILKPEIYNKIAAGEVVERPASVVKELIENSIDAGADTISIEISDGGISYIRISDNGCGMDKEDLTRAVMPHATSKIDSADDLFSINTLGFRGEALASIAAVSKMTLTSCSGADSAFSLNISGGAIEDIRPCGRGQGTTTEIRDIFFNTPVRLKFLKKPKQEEKDVTYTVSQLILANPDISFTYVADGEQIFNTSNGLLNAIYAVYGSEIAQNLIEHTRSIGDISVSGYVGKQGYGKHNRNYQTAIINGRVIGNNIISTAVAQAYGTTLMKRTYPVYVINIDMPIDQLDVNVHPNKREVRFKDSNKVFAAVYKFVMSALAQQESYLKFSQSTDVNDNDTAKLTPEPKSDNLQSKPSNNYDNTHNLEQNRTIKANLVDNRLIECETQETSTPSRVQD